MFSFLQTSKGGKPVKKFIALLVMFAVLFGSIGCGGDSPAGKDKDKGKGGTPAAKDKDK